MKQYRVPFYAKLHESLKADGIALSVAYSAASDSEDAKGDNCELPASLSVKVPGFWFARGRFLYQPVLPEIWRADLVVVEHANKHVVNHILVVLRWLRMKRFALWGLGRNKQVGRSEVSEWYKKAVVSRADWYFAYTRGVAEEVASYGLPAGRITAVQNSVDMRELEGYISTIGNEELATLRGQMGIGTGDPVGVYCGMLDSVKGIPFLIECARLVRHAVPNFHLLLVGGGPEQGKLRRHTEGLSWVHIVGPRFGREKALMLKLSDIFLIPGRVGLAILDSFAAHLPLFTVQLPIHGPEVEYLEQGVNGFMVEPKAEVYAERVIRVLQDPELLRELQQGAARSAQKYSIENMVENFRSGIRNCLGYC